SWCIGCLPFSVLLASGHLALPTSSSFHNRALPRHPVTAARPTGATARESTEYGCPTGSHRDCPVAVSQTWSDPPAPVVAPVDPAVSTCVPSADHTATFTRPGGAGAKT